MLRSAIFSNLIFVMSVGYAFYRALQKNSQFSDVAEIVYRLDGSGNDAPTKTTLTGSPSTNGGVVNLIAPGQPTFQNKSITATTLTVKTKVSAGAAERTFASFSTSFTATDQDITITSANVSVPANNIEALMTQTVTNSAGFVTPINDYNGTSTVISQHSISNVAFTVNPGSQTLNAIGGNTQTTTNTQNTYSTLNGLQMQFDTGTSTFNAATGPIATSFGGSTETTTWNDGQQLQITQYEVQFT